MNYLDGNADRILEIPEETKKTKLMKRLLIMGYRVIDRDEEVTAILTLSDGSQISQKVSYEDIESSIVDVDVRIVRAINYKLLEIGRAK